MSIIEVDSVPFRLRALRSQAGLGSREVARRLGLPSSTYQHLETRFKKKFLPLDMAERLATAFAGTPVSREDVLALSGLATRVEANHRAPPGSRLVPVLDVSASAGDGAMVGYEAVAYSLAFPAAYLERLTATSARNLMIISVNGDSMLLTLMNNDVVMIDISKKNVDFDGLFVFRYGEALHVKRVTRSRNKGHVLAISDNRALYDPIEYRMDEIEVVGRVIWRGGKV